MHIDREAPGRRPDGSPVGSQRWRHLTFLHWRVPAVVLQQQLPAGLSLDTFEGEAFVGVVPFTMKGVRSRWFPPGLSLSFHETNVRTYVHVEGRDPGVWFFSLDAADRLAVWAARQLWRLPYRFARMSLRERSDGSIEYESDRVGSTSAVSRFRVRPSGAVQPAIPGTLEHFLLGQGFSNLAVRLPCRSCLAARRVSGGVRPGAGRPKPGFFSDSHRSVLSMTSSPGAPLEACTALPDHLQVGS